jgi:iron complex transport system substrate-binding protein
MVPLEPTQCKFGHDRSAFNFDSVNSNSVVVTRLDFAPVSQQIGAEREAASSATVVGRHGAIHNRRMFPARRIICLTEETVETLYLLGEQDRIVGISGYTVRPPQARREKPRVSAFRSADIARIVDLEPDLVLAFSDIQADIVAELVRRSIAVHVFNQRTLAGIFDMIRTLGALVDAGERAEALAASLERRVAAARATRPSRRPKVFFEEWDDPLISGIGWVSELIEAAGGVDVFAELATGRTAKDRIVAPLEVVARAPDIIIGSWCGKKFRPEKVAARAGFGAIPAVRAGALHEIKSSLILQPGPAALTDGLDAIRRIVAAWPG